MKNQEILAVVKMAPGKGGKDTVRAFDSITGEDITRTIAYATLKGAMSNGNYLYKGDENSKWTQVSSES